MLFKCMVLTPEVWGKHYWFVLFTIALTYPLTPNSVTKKKYYDFVQNIPIFIPDRESSENFIKILDRYPVTPYLDSRESFVRWIHFIHNKINALLEKPEISYLDALNNYYDAYKTPDIKLKESIKNKEKYVFLVCLMILIIGIYYIY